MKKIFASRLIFGTIAVCISAVALAVFSITSSAKLTLQSKLMYDHPYQVKGETQAMRTRLSEMKLFLPSALLLAPDNPEEIKKLLTDRDHLQDESIRIIRERYLSSQQHVDDLEAAMRDLRQARLAAVDTFSSPASLDDINNYIELEVNPYSDAVDEVLLRIATYADARVALIQKTAEDTQRTATVGVVGLCIFIAAMSIATNINERRKNTEISYRKQLFDLISNSIDDVFVIYDYVNQRIEYISENSENLAGAKADVFIENPSAAFNYLTPDSVEKFNRLFENGPLSEDAECDIQLKQEHKLLEIKLRVYPVFMKNKLHRYIAVLYDQTKIIEHQNVLQDALLSAQRANTAKREFLSRMSHEIRTPMNTIIGMTTIATRHINDLEYVENSLKKIAYSSSHLLSLINDILDMSKIEDNKLTVNREAFDFRQLIESITNIVYPQTVDKKQNFEVCITDLYEEMLIGDVLRLNQILLNLLSNAVKFTPCGGCIRLEISKVSTKNKQMRLRFVVRDTGIGMNEDFIRRLYTPFEQADSSIAQKYGGTGLGMSITKNLVSLMDGSISVESNPGEGTAFSVELPFELTGQDAPVSSSELSSLNVLVVDDDQSTCDHAMVLLEQMHINASWVCSGREAVAKVVEARNSDEAFDVCFIDWCMPDMDGVETARNIRQHVGPDTLIIIISAYDWSVIEKEAREAGVNAFISKPIFISSIYNTLCSVVSNKTFRPDDGSSQENQYHFMGKKVLLAEDNFINQEIAIVLLNDVDLIVDCAENGEEALNLYKNSAENEYSLILMDIQMPLMNGYEATRAIRSCEHARAKDIPIIAMTANAFYEDVVAAKESGMNDHITKPIDVDVLYKKIAEYIEAP